MLMNELFKTRLLGLLSEPLQEVTNVQITNAYDCFMEKVRIISLSENNHLEIYRMLNNTRIELVFIESLHRYEQEKKCPEICLS